MKKAQEMMRQETLKMQAEMAAATFEGFSSDESVRALVSGNQEPRGTELTEAALEQGAERCSILVTEAYTQAHAASVAAMRARMGQLAQKLGLPPGFGQS